MREYAELPWSVEDTIENLKSVKNSMKERVILLNLHGRGEKDAEEVEFDFGRAIDALERQEKYRWHNLNKDPEDLPKNLSKSYLFENKWGGRFLKVLSESLEISSFLKHTSIQKCTVGGIYGYNMKPAMWLGGKKLNRWRNSNG